MTVLGSLLAGCGGATIEVPGTRDTFSDRSYFIELGPARASQKPTDVHVSIEVGKSGPGSGEP